MQALAAVALAAAALASAAASADATPGMQIGVQDDPAFIGPASGANHAIAAAEQLHAGAIRVIVPWADVIGAQPNSRRPPRHRHYRFVSYEGLVIRAQQRHMQVQMVLAGPAPAWATANHRKGVYKPSPGYFGEFARQAAQWFGDRVQRYSVWNEPNYISWLAPQSNAPSIYRALYQRGYASIKRVAPNAQVLIGETSPYAEPGRAIAPLAFLRGVLCNGHCPLTTDGYAHHPYDFYHSPTYHYPGADNVTISTLSRLSQALGYWARRGALRDPQGHLPPIYLTEFGYESSGGGRIDDRRHAAYLTQAYSIALRAAHVVELVQYTLEPPRGRYRFFDMSILGSHWQHRKPFVALAAWARTMQKRHLISTP